MRESSPRGEQLSFAHYREIASLPEDQQQKMIDLTLQEKLTTRALREEIKKSRGDKKSSLCNDEANSFSGEEPDSNTIHYTEYQHLIRKIHHYVSICVAILF